MLTTPDSRHGDEVLDLECLKELFIYRCNIMKYQEIVNATIHKSDHLGRSIYGFHGVWLAVSLSAARNVQQPHGAYIVQATDAKQ